MQDETEQSNPTESDADVVVPVVVRDKLRRHVGTTRVLVTGGAGFLGSHLCENLLADGHEALCVDNFFTGWRRNVTIFSRTLASS